MPTAKTRSGVSLYYEIHGEGEPLVLIAGTGSHWHKWALFQLPFFAQRYKTVVYDHRGTGKSDKPDVRYTIPMFAEDLADLLDAIGVREAAHVIGHSMGGQVAQQFAIDYPDKVNGLVLADTGSGPFDGHEFERGIPIETCMTFARVNGSVAERLKDSHLGEFWYTPEFREKKRDVLAKIVELAMLEPPPLKPYLRHIIARQNHNVTDKLDRIVAPTLILVGEDDRYAEGTGTFVRQCRHLRTRIRGSRLVLVPHARHGIFWEQPAFVNETIHAFLEELKTRRVSSRPAAAG
jgi:pimeloyl-ACP methyl ester carboxylesterase